MKKTALSLLFAALTVSAGDFNPNRTTSGNSLSIYYNDGGSSYAYKSYSASKADRSLSGTGLTGTVIDAGDHWILDVTGGDLNGRVYSRAGVEIRLNGQTVVLSNTKSGNGIYGGGGVRITGPGVLHLDQFHENAAIYAPSGKATVWGGAVVGINHLGDSTAVYGEGIRISASAVHVNAGGHAFHSESEGFDVSASIVSAVSDKDGIQLRSHGPLQVSASSVHLVSTGGTAVRSGDDIFSGGDSVSVSSSVFCAVGAEDGIQFHDNKGTLVLENAIGAVLGGDCGVNQVWQTFVDGGATEFIIAGNIAGRHSPGEIDPIALLEDNTGTGQAVHQVGTASLFRQDAGSVKLFAPGNTALSVATNVVAGGSLRVEAAPTWGDVQTLFTADGIVAAAETVAGGLAFGQDVLFADIDLAQALASVVALTDVLFDVDRSKAAVGLSQRSLFVLGGDVDVVASGTGISLGKNEYGFGYYDDAVFRLTAGSVSVVSDVVGLADLDALDGYTTYKEDDSWIWQSGGRLSVKGRFDGILTCGGILLEGGTLEAAATGGYAAGTMSADPGLVGYALSANNYFAIDGGSFLATKGTLRTDPTASNRHGWAKLYAVDMSVPDAPTDEPVVLSDFKPSWYGVNDLYPVQGKLRFWLPAGDVSLKYGGQVYSGTAGPPTTYTVKFSANGGSGSMPAQKISRGKTAKLANNAFSRPGYVFVGWAKSKTGPFAFGNAASVKDLASAGGTVTLYAQWAKKNYNVKFAANGGKGKMAVQKMTYGKAAKLRANKFKRKGCVFLGWSKTKNGKLAYKNKKAVKNLTKNGGTVTLYAQWAKKTYKVKFYANGGKGKMAVEKFAYGKAKKLSANKFKKKGYVFKGWARSKALAKKGSVVYKNKKKVKNLVKNGKTVKLYAVWKKK